MQELVDGIHSFQKHYFSTQKQLFERLALGQQPLALFITCSDSRIDPSLLTQTQPGELFILRNAGNLIPKYDTVLGGEAATIEFAVRVLKVENIIVCGHSHCGAMNGLMHPEQVESLPAVRAWLSHAKDTAKILAANYDHITDEKNRLTVTIEENVLVQLENLRTHPCVAEALAQGEMKLHGWVYKFETGQVFLYDAADGQYLPINQPTSPPDESTTRLPPI